VFQGRQVIREITILTSEITILTSEAIKRGESALPNCQVVALPPGNASR
jgi:hypothetical protein